MGSDTQFYISISVMVSLLLYGRCRARKVLADKAMLSLSIFFFVSISMQESIEFWEQASINSVKGPSGTDTTLIASLGLMFAQVSVTNSLMIYRLWVIWHQNRVITVLPLFSLVASIVCQGIFTRLTHVYGDPTDNSFPGARWLYAGLGTDVFLNVYCSVLIAYKIWDSQRQVKHATRYLREFSPYKAAAIIVESAALYTVCIIIWLIVYASGSLGSVVMVNLPPPVAGISFGLIIIRFSTGGASNNNAQLPTVVLPPSSNDTRATRQEEISMQPVTVHFDQHIKTGVSQETGRNSIDAESNKGVPTV